MSVLTYPTLIIKTKQVSYLLFIIVVCLSMKIKNMKDLVYEILKYAYNNVLVINFKRFIKL